MLGPFNSASDEQWRLFALYLHNLTLWDGQRLQRAHAGKPPPIMSPSYQLLAHHFSTCSANKSLTGSAKNGIGHGGRIGSALASCVGDQSLIPDRVK